jgi:hypothetical protein
LIFTTSHASKVFTTPITTFEETHYQQMTTMLTCFQFLSQVELMEEIGIKPIKRAINQLIVENQVNLGLWANIWRMECSFQWGIMLPRFSNM